MIVVLTALNAYGCSPTTQDGLALTARFRVR